MKRFLALLVIVTTCFWTATIMAQIMPAFPTGAHQKWLDEDGNGLPDEGVRVGGRFEGFSASDSFGHRFVDLGEGFSFGDDWADFDEETLSICTRQVIYSGEFDNNIGIDSGWVWNRSHCTGFGFEVPRILVLLVVHESDPRYTGTGVATDDDWELQFDIASGCGNSPANGKPIDDC